MAMVFSAYQTALFETALNESCSIEIQAVAGSGKTTSIVECSNRMSRSLTQLFLAFNVNIVGALKAKLPKHVACSTFNSCGWGAWRRFTGKKFIEVDGNKIRNIIKDKFVEKDQDTYGPFVARMVALAKSFGIRPNDPDERWLEVMDHQGHSLDTTDPEATIERAIDLSRKTLNLSIQMAKGLCDFDDQIYMPWLMNAAFDQFDVVFVDEAQDTNSVQKDLLRRMLKPGGRIIIVGDSNQAIYGFRGAGADSMEQLLEAFQAKPMPLSICYRCCKAVIRDAQKYVPEIEWFEDAPEGEVKTLEDYDINTFTPEDAILCRNNAPLVEMAYAFITRGRGVNFVGRDIGAGLKSLIRNMGAKNLEELSVRLEKWLDRESQKLIDKGQEEKIDLLNDRIKCIDVFINHLPESKRTVDHLLSAIDALFEAKGRGITLSSVHKSKGKEWDRVFILDFHLMPSPYAKKKAWMMKQENNLIYVAITRAQRFLGYIDSGCWTDEPNLGQTLDRVGQSGNVRSEPAQVSTQGRMVKKNAVTKTAVMSGFNPFNS